MAPEWSSCHSGRPESGSLLLQTFGGISLSFCLKNRTKVYNRNYGTECGLQWPPRCEGGWQTSLAAPSPRGLAVCGAASTLLMSLLPSS